MYFIVKKCVLHSFNTQQQQVGLAYHNKQTFTTVYMSQNTPAQP